MTALQQGSPAVAEGLAVSIKRPALPLLTSLRFFAALNVLVYHRAPALAPGFLANLAASGYEAVTFFFILSGFILVYAYDAPAASKGMTVGRRTFWWSRFSRIMPAYLLGLLIGAPVFVYAGLVSQTSPMGECVAGLILLPLLLQAWWPPVAIVWNGPAWSLSAEAFFYALFPWLMQSCRPRRAWQGIAVSMVLIVASTVARELVLSGGSPTVFRGNFRLYFPLLHVPSFLLGMALGRFFLEIPPLRRAALGWLFPFGASATLVLFGCRSQLPQWVVSPPVQASVFSMLIVGAGAARQRGMLAAPLFVLLGEASYSMYILHEPLVYWWERYIGGIGDVRTWSAFAAFAALVIVGAVATHLWIETPTRRWLLRRRPSPSDVGTQAGAGCRVKPSHSVGSGSSAT
jgi:peptidoglycan/LPS O-acetylase OafA/YrhL